MRLGGCVGTNLEEIWLLALASHYFSVALLTVITLCVLGFSGGSVLCFGVVPHDLWDLNCPTRNWTWALVVQYSCLEDPMDAGAWWAAVHGVAKSRTRLSDFTFTLHFHALEKEMATCSSVLAWRIPGMGEAGGLPSMGSHRVGHNWCDLAAAAAIQWGQRWVVVVLYEIQPASPVGPRQSYASYISPMSLLSTC